MVKIGEFGMKKSLKFAYLCAVPLGILLVGDASSATITDNYLGGIYSGGTLWDYTSDIVNDDQRFSIEKMEVNIGSSTTTIDVYTNYIHYVTADDHIEYGDLFISNDGWTPHSPTSSDYYGNGEHWEFALVLDDHDGSATSGDANLFAIGSISQYILAENTGSTVYRSGQEVQFNTTGQIIKSTGTWSIFADGIHFSIDTTSLNLSAEDLGLRWSMTCANDIIEGSVPSPVPEPATMILFGAGLAGLAAYRNRRART